MSDPTAGGSSFPDMERDRTDTELLDAFARRRDGAAFEQIVARYAGLVYSAAMRQVGPALAEDASQAVFFILAQKAQQVDGRTLAGWLVNTARYASLASRRAEVRLKQREQKAAQMQPEHESRDASADWAQLSPLLDEALSKLDEKDRSAVTLRYLQGKSVREVAAAMSTTEAAAGKRATRAIQTLRDYFARRGMRLSAESLGCAMSAHGLVDVPTALTGKLAAGSVGTAGTLSGSAATIVKGTIPLMATAKAPALIATAAVVLLGGGAAIVATQVDYSRTAISPTTLPTDGPIIQASAGVAPATQPVAPVERGKEIFTRYITPAGQPATFEGKVEGLNPGVLPEVGIVSLRGTQWTSNANYQWMPVNADGTFSIAAANHPDARRAIAVRTKGQSVTFLRAEFEANESARDIVVRMKPTKPITFTAIDSAGNPVNSFKVEIFDAGAFAEQLYDDNGRPLRPQRLDAPVTSRGVLDVVVPLEPLSVLVSGNGIAPYQHRIDPRERDSFTFSLLKATPIHVTITDDGVPVAKERVMLNNPAVAFSFTARTTDDAGHLTLPAGIPGSYRIRVRNETVETTVIEGEPCFVEIDLKDLETPATQPIVRTATMPTR